MIETRLPQSDLKRSVSSINPDADQVAVTKKYSANGAAVKAPQEAQVELPNVEFDELSCGMPTPTMNRKMTAAPNPTIEVNDSGHGTMRRSYNRLTEPLPPRGRNERSSLRQKKLDDFYNTGIGIRSMSIGGRSMMGDSFCTSSYETDENTSNNYIYIERKKPPQVYEDPFSLTEHQQPQPGQFSPTPRPRGRHISQSVSMTDSPRLVQRGSPSPRLPPRNRSPAKNRVRSKSPSKQIQQRLAVARAVDNQSSPMHQSQPSRLSVKSVGDNKDRFDMIHCLTNDPSLSPNDVFIDDAENGRTANGGRECKTRFSFNAEFDGCLTVQKGETLILCRHNNDGWSLVQTRDMQRGFVPTDYLDVF